MSVARGCQPELENVLLKDAQPLIGYVRRSEVGRELGVRKGLWFMKSGR
jgi:hypothetical protein